MLADRHKFWKHRMSQLIYGIDAIVRQYYTVLSAFMAYLFVGYFFRKSQKGFKNFTFEM